MSYYPVFAEHLNQYLRQQDRSAAWLAKRLGVSNASTSRWLGAENRPKDPETIQRIADVLGLSKTEHQELLVSVGYGLSNPGNASQHEDSATNENGNQIALDLKGHAASFVKHDNENHFSPPDKTDKLREKFVSFEAKMALVNALLACPNVRDRHTRDQIVNHLPDNIRGIVRNNSDQGDIMNIVTRVLDFSGGLAAFLNRVRFYESDSDPMKYVDTLVD